MPRVGVYGPNGSYVVCTRVKCVGCGHTGKFYPFALTEQQHRRVKRGLNRLDTRTCLAYVAFMRRERASLTQIRRPTTFNASHVRSSVGAEIFISLENENDLELKHGPTFTKTGVTMGA